MKPLKSLALGCSFLLVFSSCQGQIQKEHEALLSSKDSLNKPQINVKVNKQYDDKGNIIRFDSTYTYFYSSPKGKTHMNNDSIFKNFHSFFNKTHPDFFDNKNSDIFFNDSLFKYDFFNDDYFQKRFELNQKMFEHMFKEMDSLKQNYMQQHFPNGQQKKKQKTI